SAVQSPLGSGSARCASRNDEGWLSEKRWRRRIGEIVVEITPLRVGLFDEREFPGASPLLDVFLSRDGGAHLGMLLIPDENFAAVFLRESIDLAFSVLMCALNEIASDAEIDRAVASARHDVDSDEFEMRHRSTLARNLNFVIPDAR